MSDWIGWLLEKWPFAVIVLFLLGVIYSGMAFQWFPPVIQAVSAQTLQQQIKDTKAETAASIAGIQTQLTAISGAQSTIQKQAAEDRLDRLEQQLLWWRQQNCKSKGQARNYAWQKMEDLKAAYRKNTGTEWQMPSCADIGD